MIVGLRRMLSKRKSQVLFVGAVFFSEAASVLNRIHASYLRRGGKWKLPNASFSRGHDMVT